MALKVFRNKTLPKLGDLVCSRSITGMTGIVISVKDNKDDISSAFFKGAPRKIFTIKWITGTDWARLKIKTEFFEHQLEVISSA